MTTLLPPHPPPVFKCTPEGLITQAEHLIARNKAVIDAIVQNVAVSEAQFSNVLLPLAQEKNAIALETSIIGFFQSVSSDPDLRNASSSARKKMRAYFVESEMREDVFKLVEATYWKQKDDATLDPESRRLLEKDYKAGIRMGLHLTPTNRERFKIIKKRLSELSLEFAKHMNEEKGGVWLEMTELNGVPYDVLETLEKGKEGSENEGKRRLTFKYPDLVPTQKQCTVAETRKKLFLANENRCNQNLPLVQEALVLRSEAAQLLGYADHATFVLEEKMAKTPLTVDDFLKSLRKSITIPAQKELERLKKLKAAETGCSENDNFYLWDLRFYETLMLSRDFQFDQNRVAEYFSLQTCMSGMLNIFEQLLGLAFIEIKGKDRDAISETGNGDDIVWHPDVQLFSVWNAANEDGSQDFVGYLYFDLHPRPGKYGHAANFLLQPGFASENFKRCRCPSTALVCNFTKATATKPSLLKHNEVVTLFHELGHGIHALVSQTRYSRFHGTLTTRDFVEAPSQMLENWCWTASQIKALSRHWSYLSPQYAKAYVDGIPGASASQPEEKMPDAMIDSIIRARHASSALPNLRQIFLALFDLTVHQQSYDEAVKLDISKLYNQLRHDLMQLDDLSDVDGYHWAHGPATFSHIMQGYDGGYYGYLFSKVYSADMFHTAFSKDPLNKDAGRRYREIVLKPGGSREPMELLKEFLGREPSTEAFYQELSGI